VTNDPFADAAAAYVLGALPDDERAEFSAHLDICRACRAEVDELRTAAEALSSSAPAMVPPPELKVRIMAEVEREAARVRAAEPQAARAAPPWRRRLALRPVGAPLATVAAVAAIALLVGLGIGAIAFRSSARTVEFHRGGSLPATAAAELDVSGDKSVLVARGLPSPGGGRIYQVWLKHPGEAPQPTAALFTPRRDGSATATVPGHLGDGDQVMVTAEPDGGSPMPTSAPILAAKLD
jgi:anti-sigma-K factor RskA